jgi:hypothetical protein
MKNSKAGNKAIAKFIKKREGKGRYADTDFEKEVDAKKRKE